MFKCWICAYVDKGVKTCMLYDYAFLCSNGEFVSEEREKNVCFLIKCTSFPVFL